MYKECIQVIGIREIDNEKRIFTQFDKEGHHIEPIAIKARGMQALLRRQDQLIQFARLLSREVEALHIRRQFFAPHIALAHRREDVLLHAQLELVGQMRLERDRVSMKVTAI